MFSKFELLVGALCVIAMGTSLYLLQGEARVAMVNNTPQIAQVSESGLIIVNEQADLKEAITNAFDENGNFKRMVIDDINVGTGKEVVEGDTVSVHYAGTFQSGEEFDNSRRRGEPFEFVVGAGMVIKGWEEGLIGMKEGGERILVIPPEKAYGAAGIGPIPPDSTLVFKIELLEVKS